MPGLSADDALVRSIVTSEETYLALSRKMNMLSHSLLDLRLPGPNSEGASVFAPSVVVRDIGLTPTWTSTNGFIVESRVWPLATASGPVAQVDLWRPLLDAVSFFDHARVYLTSGEHQDGDL